MPEKDFETRVETAVEKSQGFTCSFILNKMREDPIAVDIMAHLEEVFEHDWQICRWLTSENDLLDDNKPLDMIRLFQYDEVLLAAQMLVAFE
jgi:hypothetical protein